MTLFLLLAAVVPAPISSTASFQPTTLLSFILSRTQSLSIYCAQFLGLVLSLECALLATLVSEWTRKLSQAQLDSMNENIEEKAIKNLSVQMGPQKYGLHHFASLVIEFLHTSIIVSPVGLNFCLKPIHRIPALALSNLTGSLAFAYIIFSMLPLVDSTYPLHMLLANILIALITRLAGFVTGILTYGYLLIMAT